RRETVSPARLNMKSVKIANGRAIAHDDRAHIAAFCFANGPAHGTVKAIGQIPPAAAQIECMPVEFCDCARSGLKPLAPAYFEVFPAAFSREADEPISYQIDRFRIKD